MKIDDVTMVPPRLVLAGLGFNGLSYKMIIVIVSEHETKEK